MQNGEDCEASAASPADVRHPLLDELKGLLHRLQRSSQPIRDGRYHVIVLCETIEAIFRKGLKQPNSWFGLNKQDYWSWIQTLPDYYFLDKQNPLLRQVVQSISSSNKCRTVVGCGRSFIRVALCQKLTTVPIEHLVKNERHTNYWYSSESIIGNQVLRASLMQLLFRVTEVDFDLELDHCSFLDESWVIPVYKNIPLPPVRQLDLKISYVEDRALVIEVEPGSLAEKNGVERGDILDELCGDQVFSSAHGKLKQMLQTNSELDYATNIVVVKNHLSDGSAFQPILRRQNIHDARATPTETKFDESGEHRLGAMRTSTVVKTRGDKTEYSLVCLGKASSLSPKEVEEQTVDEAVTSILYDQQSSDEVVLEVGPSLVTLLNSTSDEIIGKFAYHNMCGCGRGVAHESCFTLMAREEGSSSLSVFAFEALSSELAHTICAHIAKGFNQSTSENDSEFEELS